MQIMTPEHPRWNEFITRLEGPEGCNVHLKDPTDPKSVVWTCGGGDEKSFASKILNTMFEIDVKKSLEFFEEKGGFCDCEILLNVV